MGLDELLSKSDFVSINLPMLPETRGLVGEREFGLLKPTAHVINLARGPIWDEKALYTILKEGRIAGAASDVFEVEPATKDHPLLQLENFIGTPHMAAHTDEALRRMSRVAMDILRVLEGKKPPTPSTDPSNKTVKGLRVVSAAEVFSFGELKTNLSGVASDLKGSGPPTRKAFSFRTVSGLQG